MNTSLKRIGALVLLALAAAGCPPSGTQVADAPAPRENAPRHLDAPYVVLVSFDGFRYDYPELHEAPNFLRVAREGARAERMIPIFPTKTFPNHYTIATGMYAEHHGLVGNRFWDPDRRALYRIDDRSVVEDGSWYRGEPIWVTAERQGMLAASFYFVGSEADVGGIRPTYWKRYDGSVPNEVRVDTVLAWLRLPPARRPHMITLYFSETDDAGHRYGPRSPELAAAVRRVDAQLGRLLEGIDALPHGHQVTVVLVSDHGMMRAPADDVDVYDPALFPGVRLIESGPYASLVVDEGGAERARAVRDSLRALMPANGVYLREEVPERLHYRSDPRIGDIVIVAAPGRTVVTPDRVPGRDTFTHGWDNAVREMGAIFMARGPRIRPGARAGPFESIHVYPFLAELLGLEANPAADGRLDVLAPLLRD